MTARAMIEVEREADLENFYAIHPLTLRPWVFRTAGSDVNVKINVDYALGGESEAINQLADAYREALHDIEKSRLPR